MSSLSEYWEDMSASSRLPLQQLLLKYFLHRWRINPCGRHVGVYSNICVVAR